MSIKLSTPERRELLKKYFFPLKKPEAPGCMNDIYSMLGGMDAKERQSDYEDDRRKFYALLEKWEMAEGDLFGLPTSKQVDEWLQENLDHIRDRGLEKLGLGLDDILLPEEFSDLISTKAENPMQIYGPLLTVSTVIPNYENVFVRRDGLIRFSCHEVMIVALTKSRIATYTCHFNGIHEAIVQESAKEFLYHDVVSVATEEEMSNYTFSTGEKLSIRRQFKLAVASGDNIVVSVASPEIREKLGAAPKLSDHDESVRAIREMMRAKRDDAPQQRSGQNFQQNINEDPHAKLIKLKDMLDADLITEEEFNDKKADILSKM